MSLYNDHRPDELEDVRGNKNIIPVLQRMMEKPDKAPHVFMFYGPTGCGKTTLARIVARKLDAHENDVKELDAAVYRGIDSVRDLREKSNYLPMSGKRRVWILDEVHKMTKDAQNALLKILEDPPSHTYFILCTTEPQNVISTVKGRCSMFEVELLSERQMGRLLKTIVRAEKAKLDDEVYDQIIMDSLGHPRNAIQTLEQVLLVDPDKRLEIAKRKAEELSQTIELCRALINGVKWSKVMPILRGLKETDPETIRYAVLGYANNTLLKTENDQAALILENFVEPFYTSKFAGVTLACYTVINGD